MRRVEQRAQSRQVAALDRGHRVEHALVLRDHVACAAPQRIGERHDPVEILDPELPEK